MLESMAWDPDMGGGGGSNLILSMNVASFHLNIERKKEKYGSKNVLYCYLEYVYIHTYWQF